MTGTVGYLARVDDFFVFESAGHDAIAHAREDTGNILGRLAPVQADFFMAQQQAIAAELRHRDGEADARSQARLFENHRQRLAGQERIVSAGCRCCFLRPRGDVEQVLEFVRVQSAREMKWFMALVIGGESVSGS